MKSLRMVVEEIPTTLEAFLVVQGELARSPEGGAVTMVLALLAHAEGSEHARRALAAAIDRVHLVEGDDGHDGWEITRAETQRLERRIAGRPHLLRSYLAGTAPESGYRLPEAPFVIEVGRNPYSGDEASGDCKVFVECSGAASPRPVTLRRDDAGLWKAREWSSLTLGVVEPEAEDA